MADAAKTLRIVAFQEGDVWIAQCVELDLCVQGKDLAQAQRRMSALITLEAAYTTEKHGEAFRGIDPAPDYFAAMFEGASASLEGDLNFRLAA